jgi:Icc-related predicted phosphoesterase
MSKKILSVSDLHGVPNWCEWVVNEVKSEGYDAVLFPGDLLDGMPPHINRELDDVLAMLIQLSDVDIPVLICSGNHDGGAVVISNGKRVPGLMEHLLINRDRIPSVRLDEEILEIGNIRIRSVPYIGEMPAGPDGDNIWLYHEPPFRSPISQEVDGDYLGDHCLARRAYYEPDSLPPLVICGHVHSAKRWWTGEVGTLFLNSGQNLKADIPHHFRLELTGKKLRILHYPSGQSIVRDLAAQDPNY